MSLTAPTARRHIHTRRYHFEGFEREDGLWDIEGRIVDEKTHPFDNTHRGCIEAGEPLHDMSMRITIDDTFRVHEIEATTEASPFRICSEAAPKFQRMVGVRIGLGWRQEIKARLGGAEGCTHLSEMLVAMATVAFQTLYPILSKRANLTGLKGRPPLLNSCHAFRSDGEVVRTLWPEHYREAESGAPEESNPNTTGAARGDR